MVKIAPCTNQNNMMEASKETIESFVDDVQSLWLQSLRSTIPVLSQPPTAMEFLRNFVAVSRPCIIRNVPMSTHPPIDTIDPKTKCGITLDALVQMNPNLELTVDVTPDGYGDCLRRIRKRPVSNRHDDNVDTDDHHDDSQQAPNPTVGAATKTTLCFVQPTQRTMTIQQFQQKLRQQQSTKQLHSTTTKWKQSDRMDRIFDVVLPTCTTDDDDWVKDLHQDRADDNENDHDDNDDDDGVLYYSRQNDCLRTELSSIWDQMQLPHTFDWVQGVFGNTLPMDNIIEPSAINIWIGNECSASAMHKDYYENLYYVASGEKIITLCPPSDVAFLYEQEYISGRFVQDPHDKDTTWKVQLDNQKVHWVGADVTRTDTDRKWQVQKLPLLQYTTPITVRVQAHEMLYIPALWFHHVTQSCETIAINYWFEMNFHTPLYTYFHLLQQMQASTNVNPDDDDEQ
jgi:hypothetical protein